MRRARYWIERLWSHYIRGAAPPGTVQSVYIAVMLVLVAGVYANSLQSPFQFDAIDGVAMNRNLRDLGNLQKVLFSWLPPRPLVDLSFALNYHFGGVNPLGYHLVNVALHVANCIFVYLIIRALAGLSQASSTSKNRNVAPLALFAALLFGIHPVNTEAVAYIWGRSDILCGFFYLLAFLFFIKSRGMATYSHNERSKIAVFLPYFMSLLFYIMALGSKAIALSFPILILISDVYFFAKFNTKRIIKSLLWVHSLFIIISLTRIYFRLYPITLTGGAPGAPGAPASGPPAGAPPPAVPWRIGSPWSNKLEFFDNVMTQFYAVVHYIRLLFWPFQLNADHDFPAVRALSDPAFLLSCGAVVLLVLGAVWLYRSARLASFGILWFLTTLAFYFAVPLPDLLVERRLYLPSVGFCLGVTVGLVAAGGYLRTVYNTRISRAVAGLVPIVCVAVLATATISRNVVWSDPLLLWSDTIRKSPQKARPYHNFATTNLRQRRFAAAVEASKQALAVAPDSGIARYNLLEAYLFQGAWTELAAMLRETLRENPAYAVRWAAQRRQVLQSRRDVLRASLSGVDGTLTPTSADADTHVATGLVYLAVLNDGPQALEHLRAGLRFRLRHFRPPVVRRIAQHVETQLQNAGRSQKKP